jgi:NAD(P)-dependent dehydrogenase (short-subunit alcohol dehydrogenase family)
MMSAAGQIVHNMAALASLKHVLVTGGNSGIGAALCKLLVSEHACYVYLGSRDAAKGAAAVASIVAAFPAAAAQLELLVLDVNDNASVLAAASVLQARGVTLYALVNNAGVGLAHGDLGGAAAILNTNYEGPKRVTAAMVPLIDPAAGRIVNTSSGVASAWLRQRDEPTKCLFSNPNLTLAELDAAVATWLTAEGADLGHGGYGLSKAALTALTLVHAKAYPALKVTSLSPGFIDTKLTKGFGAKLTAEQGCVSALKCLFSEEVVSGSYYGSDGLRSPLTCTRDPGMPEYQGEPNPDPAIYNK